MYNDFMQSDNVLANSIFSRNMFAKCIDLEHTYVKSKLDSSMSQRLNQPVQDTHGAEGASMTIGGHCQTDLRATQRDVLNTRYQLAFPKNHNLVIINGQFSWENSIQSLNQD
jgi:hypothetical protein